MNIDRINLRDVWTVQNDHSIGRRGDCFVKNTRSDMPGRLLFVRRVLAFWSPGGSCQVMINLFKYIDESIVVVVGPGDKWIKAYRGRSARRCRGRAGPRAEMQGWRGANLSPGVLGEGKMKNPVLSIPQALAGILGRSRIYPHIWGWRTGA
jgi:hypothetical protein